MAKNESSETAYWAGFDLGGTKMLASVFDDSFKTVLGKKRRKTKGQEGAKAGVSRMIDTLEDALEEAGITKKQLNGIGVGCPGPLNLDLGIILNTPNLGWKNVKLRDALEEAFQCPVVIGNDVDIGLYGEYKFGAAKGARCAVGIFPGTGIGGGCIYDGKILRGKTSSCFEIGHIPILPKGPTSGIGLEGTLESVSSRLSIASLAAAAAYRGDAPVLLEIAGTDLSEIRSGTLAKSVEKGDKAVEDIIIQAAHWIGVGAATAVQLVTPEVLVLGGGLVEAMPDLFKKEVRASMEEHLMPSYKNTVDVKIAQLGDDSCVTGAAAWAAENCS